MNAVAAFNRPVLRWHGGKWRLAPWVNRHLPPHRIYVEPFGGAASVLLQKPRSYAEVYNDLDGEVVGLFRILREPEQAQELARLLELTPFARIEFELARQPADDPMERARRLVIRSYMGFGSNAHASTARGHGATGFRSNSHRAGTTPAHDWRNYPAALAGFTERLRGVVIEDRDALKVMAQHDREDTLHYVDPPYLPETRTSLRPGTHNYRMYRHELDEDGHRQLLAFLKTLKGMVVLSGYPSGLYAEALADWRCERTVALADGAKKRIEALWLNDRAAAAVQGVLPCIGPAA